MSLKIGSLFSGYGGLDMGVQAVIGGEVAWHVEFDDAPSKILKHHWPGVPNYGDITAVDWTTVPPVDVLTGGFPCQDLSLAGRRAGMRDGTRSGLWSDYLKAIDVLRPGLVVIENVRGLLSGCAESDLEPCPGCVGDGEHRPVLRALGRVLGDLADIGYDAEWVGLRAADAGAPHGRYRVFVIAHPAGEPWRVGDRDDVRARRGAVGRESATGSSVVAHTAHLGRERPGYSRPVRVGSQDYGRATSNAGRSRFRQHSGEPPEKETGTPAGDLASSDGERRPTNEWGPFAPAIERWAHIIGRTAPGPRDAEGELAVRAVEFMMGLPEGHVSDPSIGISKTAAKRVLGNGVVPQQATAALRLLLSPR